MATKTVDVDELEDFDVEDLDEEKPAKSEKKAAPAADDDDDSDEDEPEEKPAKKAKAEKVVIKAEKKPAKPAKVDEDDDLSEDSESDDEDSDDESEDEETEDSDEGSADILDSDDDDDEDVVEEKPAKKSKKVDAKINGKKTKATLITDKDDDGSDGKFQPDKAAKEIAALSSELNKSWLKTSVKMGSIFKKAARHFKKDREEFTSWVTEYTGMSYGSARFYIQVSKTLGEHLPKLLECPNFGSGHAKVLVTLKKPALIEEFLDQEKYKIRKNEFELAELSADQLTECVDKFKNAKGMKKKEDKSPKTKFLRYVSRTLGFVNKSWDEFRDYSGKELIAKKELTETEVETVAAFVTRFEEAYQCVQKLKLKYKLTAKKAEAAAADDDAE
jgi:hypothetical protein